MKANYIFNEIDEDNKKIKLYFQDEDGDIHEISMTNADYINNKLAEWGISKVDQIDNHFAKSPEVEIYQYERTAEDGTVIKGDTLDKPFPTASDAKKMAIVAGKVLEVTDNGLKVAIKVDTPDGPFTVVRSYYVFNKAKKQSYPIKAKKDKLLRDFKIKKFEDLKGKEVQFIRQSAGKNFYFDLA